MVPASGAFAIWSNNAVLIASATRDAVVKSGECKAKCNVFLLLKLAEISFSKLKVKKPKNLSLVKHCWEEKIKFFSIFRNTLSQVSTSNIV